jgi:hypothetical protein
MGNSVSHVLKKYKHKCADCVWPYSLDAVVVYYLFTMSDTDLRKMLNVSHCNQWVDTIYALLKKNTVNKDLISVTNRITHGDHKSSDTSLAPMAPMEVAKFYVKVVHVYAVIFFSINPSFTDNKDTGSIEKILKYNSCKSKLAKKIDAKSTRTGSYVISGGGNNDNNDIPIVPEIQPLYYDTYNPKTGLFKDMSDVSKQRYRDDLKLFYNTFSSDENDPKLPSHIKTFEDIQRSDASTDVIKDLKFQENFQRVQTGGGSEQSNLNNTFNTLSSQLFMKYATTLKQLIRDTNNTNNTILGIFSDLFVFVDEEETEITINPDLTSEKLKNIIVRTREVVIKLYLNCEMNYTKSVQLYESIVEQKILETTQKQIKSLKDLRDTLISE